MWLGLKVDQSAISMSWFGGSGGRVLFWRLTKTRSPSCLWWVSGSTGHYSVLKGPEGIISNLGFEVQTLPRFNEHFDIKRWKLFHWLRLGSVQKKGGVWPLDQFKQIKYLKLQFSELLCMGNLNSKTLPKEARVQITNFCVNCLVLGLIYQNLGPGFVVET